MYKYVVKVLISLPFRKKFKCTFSSMLIFFPCHVWFFFFFIIKCCSFFKSFQFQLRKGGQWIIFTNFYLIFFLCLFCRCIFFILRHFISFTFFFRCPDHPLLIAFFSFGDGFFFWREKHFASYFLLFKEKKN